jgi:hypothetical protein
MGRTSGVGCILGTTGGVQTGAFQQHGSRTSCLLERMEMLLTLLLDTNIEGAGQLQMENKVAKEGDSGS